jgi:hypothetical protein
VPKKARKKPKQPFFEESQTRPKKPEKRQKMPDDFQNAKFPQIWLRKTPSGNTDPDEFLTIAKLYEMRYLEILIVISRWRY